MSIVMPYSNNKAYILKKYVIISVFAYSLVRLFTLFIITRCIIKKTGRKKPAMVKYTEASLMNNVTALFILPKLR